MLRLFLSFLMAMMLVAAPAHANDRRGGGRMLLTDGVTAIEGSAGGGIATWATIAGAETRNGIGGTVHATAVLAPDFTLRSQGIATGLFDRVELSYARQSLDTDKAGTALGLGRGYRIAQDVFGAKVRLIGNLVYDQDTALPQIAVGVQRKRANRSALVAALGARSDTGTDYYVAATKLVLKRGVLLNATLRMTKANQGGLLGFGGDKRPGYRAQIETSAGVMLSPRLVIGAEYRTKPDNLRFAKEQDWGDMFAAYAVSRNITATVAYADLGSIATFKKQRSLFLSLRGRF
jgi:hypothetical protein